MNKGFITTFPLQMSQSVPKINLFCWRQLLPQSRTWASPHMENKSLYVYPVLQAITQMWLNIE